MEIFQKYVAKFDMEDKMIKNKYDHTLRVADLTKKIAQSLGMDEKDSDIAYLCGLYHDIGRFMQAKKYHSFNDSKTIDHGDLGYKIFLNEIASKEDLSSREESIIAKSIMYHNKLKVPSKITNLQKQYVSITRDADKIDILYQLATGKITLTDDDNEVSSKVAEKFLKEESISHSDIQNKTDQIILFLAFVFDIAYITSLKIIKENNYLEKIEERLNNKKYDKYFKIVNKYMKERLKC